MAWKLGLLTTLDHNPGDDFIREGILAVIRSLSADEPPHVEAVNKHRPFSVYPNWHPARYAHEAGWNLKRGGTFLRRHTPKLAPLGFSRFDRCDLVIQCGTPVLWPDCRNSEWADPIWRDVLARLAPQLPVLNLGGGSCYPWQRQPVTLVGDPDEQFVRLMLRTSALTTVRDHHARQLLGSLGADVRQMPCPASLAGQSFVQPTPARRKVLINYMAGGGHYRWAQAVTAEAWETTMCAAIAQLTREWDLVFMCHSAGEAELAARLWPALPRVTPQTPQEYFAAAQGAAFGVFNRLHAGVACAGLGIPSVCIGTDTRNLMAAALGLPTIFVPEATTPVLLDVIAKLIATRDRESMRLLALREQTFASYVELLRPWVEFAQGRGRRPAS
jgi:hypothetical protein